MNRSLSVYLDLLRGLAALAVVAGHLATTREWTGFKPLGLGIQNDAVVAFFVLSGFVIAFAARTRHATGSDFLRARLARLWSVVVPLLPVTLALDVLGHRIDSTAYLTSAPFASKIAVGGVMALSFTTQLGPFAVTPWSIVPFWSLSYEFAYYVIFACGYYLHGWKRVAALAVAVPLAGPRILLLLPIWLAGVAIEHFHRRLSPRIGWTLFLGSLIAYPLLAGTGLAITLTAPADAALSDLLFLGWSQPVVAKYLIGLIFVCNILGFATIAERIRFPAFTERPIRWVAGMTLTIYLFHHPLLSCLAAILPGQRGAVWRVVALALTALALMPLLAAIGEHRKRAARWAVDLVWQRAHLPT